MKNDFLFLVQTYALALCIEKRIGADVALGICTQATHILEGCLYDDGVGSGNSLIGRRALDFVEFYGGIGSTDRVQWVQCVEVK